MLWIDNTTDIAFKLNPDVKSTGKNYTAFTINSWIWDPSSGVNCDLGKDYDEYNIEYQFHWVDAYYNQ